MRKMIKYVLIALMPVFSIAHAQNTGAYVTDSSGQVVKSGFGLCWRTSSWTPATATKECDPDLFKDEVITPKRAEEVKPKVEEVQPKPPVVKQAVSVVLKTFFNFDKSDLSQENKDKLRDVAAKIKEFNIEVITLRGHADRIGTDDYNQGLSERRAEVVKAELVRLGVDSSKIYTEAKGEREPVVNCPGKTSSKVISCFAPNRRVEIEVVGSAK